MPGPATVILVRHADIAGPSSTNPNLSPAGKRRATELARFVKALTAPGGVVRGLFSSEFNRTRETLQPLSTATGIPVTVINASQVANLVTAILAVSSGIVVVAGHSDTVPDISNRLGVTSAFSISESQFNRLFIVTGAGTPTAQVVEVRYGA
jgi:phosphohistidine phosphatase SixA